MTTQQPRFEDQLAQLEALVRQLEQGDLPLDQALKVFEEGNKLVAACRGQLEKVELQVEQVINAAGQTAPYPTE